MQQISFKDSNAEPSTKNNTPPIAGVTQSFEWIPHGDKNARRRARAHVTRGFRREKAAKAQQEKEQNHKSDSSSQSSGSPPQDDQGDSLFETISPDVSFLQPYEKAREDPSEDPANQRLILQPTLGSGRNDPFGSMPVELSPGTHALLDHFLSGVAPVSFMLDTHADFSPVKTLSFHVALGDPSAFHVVLSAAANDIAMLHGSQDSSDAIMHRGIALGMVNKRLRQWGSDTSDASIAAVALLSGNELLFGTPKGFNTHMEGLASMLKLRGGLEPFRDKNPQLYSIISWFDYSGSCNLVARRRFTPEIYDSEIFRSNPEGVPANILRGLPIGYDLYQSIADVFRGLNTVTSLLRSNDSDNLQRSEGSAFITKIDSNLYRSIMIPDTEGVRSRRKHIQQSLELLALIYAALASIHYKNGGISTDHFMGRFQNVVMAADIEWGLAVVNFFRFLLATDEFSSYLFAGQISHFVEVSAPLPWESWRDIKKLLLDFFAYDEACDGRLQTLWQRRISTVST